MQTNQDMVAYFLKSKWDFDSKNSKWILKYIFKGIFWAKVFYF